MLLPLLVRLSQSRRGIVYTIEHLWCEVRRRHLVVDLSLLNLKKTTAAALGKRRYLGDE